MEKRFSLEIGIEPQFGEPDWEMVCRFVEEAIKEKNERALIPLPTVVYCEIAAT